MHKYHLEPLTGRSVYRFHIQQMFLNFEKQTIHEMKTLNISISDIEYNKFGIKNSNLAFSDFVDIISRELAMQNLNRSVALAEKYGLSDMSMDEIDQEVKAARKDAENNH